MPILIFNEWKIHQQFGSAINHIIQKLFWMSLKMFASINVLKMTFKNFNIKCEDLRENIAFCSVK